MKADIVFMEQLPHRHEPPPLSATTEALIAMALVLVLVVPCFWLPTIHFGDLSSHSYNAWLAGEVRAGRMHGLTLAHPMTNVLTDMALEWLIRSYGRATAEPVVMAVLAEVFFWGLFLFVGRVHGRKPWLMAPSMTILTYGLIFHFGFLNFYLSTGVSLWLLWLLWLPTPKRMVAAVPVAVLAFLAHPMPLAWAAGALLYTHLCRRANEIQRPFMLFGGAGVLIVVQFFLTTRFPNQWSLDQVFSLEGMTGLAGVEQAWIYGAKYLLVSGGLFVVWGLLFLQRLDRGKMIQDPLVHLWWLTALAFVIMPKAIQFEPDMFALLYVPQRISLFIAILFCALAGGAPHGKRYTRASLALAGAFFFMMYLDQQALDNAERQVARLLESLPPRQRVIFAVRDSGSERLNGLVHIGSGACIGRCYDYANYEPAAHQFRIVAQKENEYVAHTMDLVRDIEEGDHVVTPNELPLYSVCSQSPANPSGLYLKKYVAGEKTCIAKIPATPQLMIR